MDCLEAILTRKECELKDCPIARREKGVFRRPFGPPPEAVRIRASLTSNSFRAPLRQANNDPRPPAPKLTLTLRSSIIGLR
jgi:hypothetical protein